MAQFPKVGSQCFFLFVEVGYAQFLDIAVQGILAHIAVEPVHQFFIRDAAPLGHAGVLPNPVRHSLIVGSEILEELPVDGSQEAVRHVGEELLHGEGQHFLFYARIILFQALGQELPLQFQAIAAAAAHPQHAGAYMYAAHQHFPIIEFEAFDIGYGFVGSVEVV